MKDFKAEKTEIQRAANTGLRLLNVMTPPSIHPFSMISSDADVPTFIELSKSIGDKLLYYFEEGSKDNSGNVTPTRIELAFPYNGIVNVLVLSEEPPVKVTDSGTSRVSVTETDQYEYLFRDMDKLVDSIVRYVTVNLDFMSPDTFNLRYFFKKFWISKGIDPEKATGTLKDRIDETEAKAMSAIKNQK